MQSELLSTVLDKSSPIPVYHQIATNLRSRLMSHEWKVGEKIPTEFMLSDYYDVNRITVRKALEELERDGLIRRFRGIGAIVQNIPSPIVHDMSLPSTLRTKIGQTGTRLDAEMLVMEVLNALPPQIAQALDVPAADPVVYSSRTFLNSGTSIALNKSWIPKAFVPDMAEKGLLNNHLSITLAQRYGLSPVKITNRIEAVRPTAADVGLLHIQYDTPVIQITSVSFLPNGKPLEYSQTLWRGDRVTFTFDMD